MVQVEHLNEDVVEPYGVEEKISEELADSQSWRSPRLNPARTRSAGQEPWW
jgi:hypothetical protein